METTNLKEPQLTYAIDASGRMVSIESVENGLACNCICPKCKQPLIAKNEGRTRHKHFAHQGIYGETTSCIKGTDPLIDKQTVVAVVLPPLLFNSKQKTPFTFGAFRNNA